VKKAVVNIIGPYSYIYGKEFDLLRYLPLVLVLLQDNMLCSKCMVDNRVKSFRAGLS
jgi:hypothetical protein